MWGCCSTVLCRNILEHLKSADSWAGPGRAREWVAPHESYGLGWPAEPGGPVLISHAVTGCVHHRVAGSGRPDMVREREKQVQTGRTFGGVGQGAIGASLRAHQGNSLLPAAPCLQSCVQTQSNCHEIHARSGLMTGRAAISTRSVDQAHVPTEGPACLSCMLIRTGVLHVFHDTMHMHVCGVEFGIE